MATWWIFETSLGSSGPVPFTFEWPLTHITSSLPKMSSGRANGSCLTLVSLSEETLTLQCGFSHSTVLRDGQCSDALCREKDQDRATLVQASVGVP